MNWTQVDTAIEAVRVAINTNALRMLKQFRDNTFAFKPFSARQKKVLTWWCDNSPVKDRNGIIADGSIRSGKTLSMSLSFVFWAMSDFEGCNFAICGKTIGSLRRNVIIWLKLMLKSRGYTVHERRTDNLMIVRRGDTINFFYLFGGRDERSQDLIQGITLAGVLFDEVALMPESFVNQATARCSVDGSKWWFNCNPQGPGHWFYKKWIKRCRTLGLLYLHFTMEDNISLSEEIKDRYKRQYNGVFFQRYIMGLWVLAEGLVYPQFAKAVATTEKRQYTQYQIAIDYGIHNPTCFGLFGLCSGSWYLVKEFYHSGRDTNNPKTDEEYYADLVDFAGELPIRCIIVDPSASSFITLIRRKGKYSVRPADNAVLEGIRNTAMALNNGRLRVNDCCIKTIEESGIYSWDEKAEVDKPKKESDHAMDMVRYFVNHNKRGLLPVGAA